MEIIALIIGIFGLLGLIPIFIEFDKYLTMLKFCFSKQDLVYESLEITFVIESKERIDVYETGKLLIKKNHPILELSHFNSVGKISHKITRIDNLPISNKYLKKDPMTDIMRYESNKKVGEKIIYEDEFTCTLDPNKLNFNDDGCQTELTPYKCKYLYLNVIFPTDFIPSNLNFYEKYNSKTKKCSKETKHYACYANNRKQIHWSIKYPKYKHIYSINWRWTPE